MTRATSDSDCSAVVAGAAAWGQQERQGDLIVVQAATKWGPLAWVRRRESWGGEWGAGEGEGEEL